MEVLILRGTERRCERIAGVSVVCVPVTQSNCRRAALPRSRLSKKPSSLSRTMSINALFVDIAPNYDITPRTLEPAVFPGLALCKVTNARDAHIEMASTVLNGGDL
ncbi:hypothetical protein CEXT_415101 [Caerostris extrusa]|uniref:Uncharacterized protein n=1 Tax=Caerostris extrusa TaxID=172846 RepID=A0AAV4NSL3_CAEEX|nr:hypothetical protein CEXT_415101 [Caerostris extrusa]